jgi:hypothetical protein
MEFLDEATKEYLDLFGELSGSGYLRQSVGMTRAHLKGPARSGTAEGGPRSRLGTTPRHALAVCGAAYPDHEYER